jgi:hypothetical protein
MAERDFYGIIALVLGLSVSLLLQSAVLRRHGEDISYLMDNTVTKQTLKEA